MASGRGDSARTEQMFLPEIGNFTEFTSRTKFSRKVVIEEEFSESEVSIKTPVCEARKTTGSGLFSKKPNNMRESDIQLTNSSCCPEGTEDNHGALSGRISLPEAELRSDWPTSSRKRTKSSSPDDAGSFDKNAPEDGVTSDQSSVIPGVISPKRLFRKTVSKVNNVLLAGRLPSSVASGKCGCAGRLSVDATIRDGNQMINPRRKSFSIDGLRQFEVTKIDRCLLYAVLRPLIIAMKSAGVFYIRDKNRLVQIDASASYKKLNKHRVFNGLHIAYCVVICLIFAVNFVLSFWTLIRIEIFRLSFETTFALTWCILWLESFLRVFVCLVTCAAEENNLTALLCQIEKVCYADGIIPYEQSLGKFKMAFFSLSCIDVIAAIAVNAYAFFFDDSLLELMEHLWHYADDYAHSVGYVFFRIAVLLSVGLSKATSAMNTSLFAIVTYILYKEFVFFCRNLAAKITTDGEFPCNLEKFRLNHEARCKLVDTTNGVFKVSGHQKTSYSGFVSL